MDNVKPKQLSCDDVLAFEVSELRAPERCQHVFSELVLISYLTGGSHEFEKNR